MRHIFIVDEPRQVFKKAESTPRPTENCKFLLNKEKTIEAVLSRATVLKEKINFILETSVNEEKLKLLREFYRLYDLDGSIRRYIEMNSLIKELKEFELINFKLKKQQEVLIKEAKGFSPEKKIYDVFKDLRVALNNENINKINNILESLVLMFESSIKELDSFIKELKIKYCKPTTPESCSAELKELKNKEAEKIKKKEKWEKNNSKLKDFSGALVEFKAQLISQINIKILNTTLVKVTLDLEISYGCRKYISSKGDTTEPIYPQSAYCLSLQADYMKYINIVNESIDIIEKLEFSIPIFEKIIYDLNSKSEGLYADWQQADYEYKKANKAWKKCAGIPNLNFNLKSNLSCKQIKQKIKTVNQKIISLNRKSLGLKYGINSLPILNINKKFSDENIKRTKELIVRLDKLKPINSENLNSKKFNNINPDSSFYDIYKKAKDDLASYQTEGKILEAKLKILNLKEKTTPEKKIRFKNKISNLFKQLKTC